MDGRTVISMGRVSEEVQRFVGRVRLGARERRKERERERGVVDEYSRSGCLIWLSFAMFC